MNQKFTHTTGRFSALFHRVRRIVGVVLILSIVAGPVHASTWKPTALVNTEAFQVIDDTDTVANVVLKFGDTLAKTLIYNRTSTRFEFNDNVYVTGSIGAAGSLSGASLFGLGLTNCSDPTTSKLLYDSSTGRFSCGTDQSGGGGSSFGSGNVLTIGNANYVKRKGDSMTGSLQTPSINLSGVLLTNMNGFDQSLNLNTAGLATNSITHITNQGNLTNIGSIQSGEINATMGGILAAKSDYVSQSSPIATAIGDVNGDGKADVVTAGGGVASVFLNSGTGGFLNKVNYSPGAAPDGVVIGDVNGDGRADLAVANYSGNSVSILLNKGNGTFATKADYPTGAAPQGISIGDLNGDGKLDIATANNSATTVSVLLNNGDGTFATNVDYTVGSGPISVAIGDVNGDGYADLAVLNSSTPSVSILTNKGNGTFNTNVDYTTGSNPQVVLLGDLNGDKKLDMAVDNYGTDRISVFINNGNGTFATKVDYTTGSGPYTLAMGDVNGDGKPDLATTNVTSSTLSVLMNKGSGTFATKVDYPTASNPFSLVMGDVNGDGKDDIVAANYSAGTISVFMNLTKTILYASAGSGGTVGIGTTTPGSKLSVSGSVLINPNGNITNTAADPGIALEVVGTLSGSALKGAGLSSCSNSTTSKLLYDSATGRFSCGTDQNSGGGGGLDQTAADQRYVQKQGDTMTGSLAVNGNLTFGDAISDAITVNAGSWTFANDTNFDLSGGVNGLSFDTNTFSVDALNNRIGINTNAPKARLDVVGTISGSLLRASNMTVSGAVVYSSGTSLAHTAKGLSGQLLISQGTDAPQWKNPAGGMIWYFDGTQAVASSKGPMIPMPIALTLSGIILKAKGAPTGAALIYNIRKDGISIFSTRPQIDDGATSGGSNAVFSTTILPVDSVLTIDIDQVGSTFAGSGVTVMLKGVRRY